MDKKQLIIHLYKKYLDNQASADEIKELFQLIDNSPQSDMEGLTDDAFLKTIDASAPTAEEQERLDRIYQGVLGKTGEDNNIFKRLKPFVRYGVAASILLSIGLTFYFNTGSVNKLTEQSLVQNDVKPGSNKATLTLADGKTIDLSNDQKGIIIDSENIKYADGSSISTLTKETMLAISTPKGGQYQITLADGTKVWLNAASTLKYPSRFNGKERRVQVEGEAYFEVAKELKNKVRTPFVVASAIQEVKVLGTHFNINAYTDEGNTKTTLFEGSVAVSTISSPYSSPAILTPGQQSTVSNNNIQVNTVDLEEAIAWQKGYFLFANENIKSIMRKVARWYDVEVHYEGNVANKAIGGTVSRYENVSEILAMLSNTKAVKFKIEGKRITVMPYQ
ncbi:FecR family protein [Pedobacter nyackensis]|uniref:FecR family protein n=1 Tax=Pedobacter nyackensis TaxID=475255 RepID=UPI00292E8FD1|nr:FecR domain-containing protein [Pedobacter nyackensis]